MMSKKILTAGALGMFVATTGMMNSQCQQNPDLLGLEGIWTLTRGGVEVRINFTTNNGGEVTENSSTSELQPLDPNDFPAELAELIAQWNNGLDELNMTLDEALPDTIGVTFPQLGVMRIFDPNNVSMQGSGLINNESLNYVFLADLSGAAAGSEQGGGAVLQGSGVTGQFNAAALTTEGEITRTLFVALGDGMNNSASFTAQIAVAFTGQRTSDLPDNLNLNVNDNSNENENENENENSNDNGNANDN